MAAWYLRQAETLLTTKYYTYIYIYTLYTLYTYIYVCVCIYKLSFVKLFVSYNLYWFISLSKFRHQLFGHLLRSCISAAIWLLIHLHNAERA